MDKLYKNNIEPKKPAPKEYVLHESTYRKLQYRQNKSLFRNQNNSDHQRPWWQGVRMVAGRGMARAFG